MSDPIGWFAEQIRKLYDVVPVELSIDAGRDGVRHLTVTEPGVQPTRADLVSRFRARSDGNDGLEVTAMLTIGAVAQVRELLGTSVIDAAAMRRLAHHQLQQAFPAGPAPSDLDVIGLFDPTIGRGWLLEMTA